MPGNAPEGREARGKSQPGASPMQEINSFLRLNLSRPCFVSVTGFTCKQAQF